MRMSVEEIRARLLPFARLMGVELCRAEPDLIEAALTVREELCTVPPTLHGGAIMALADTLGGIGAYINLPPEASGTTTIESKTNFLGAARLGMTVVARAEPVHRGRRTQVWQTRITGPDDRLIAQTVQTQLVL